MSDGRNTTPRDLVPGFASLIKKRREEFEWSRHELARQAEVGMTTVCDIEDERRSPSLRVAMQLAKALKIDIRLTSSFGAPRKRKQPKANA
jgi:DNA-binding XRE family transcriptional regulator